MKQIINTKNAPVAIGPYSQGIKTNNLMFFSGQIPLDPTTGKVVDGGVKEQTKQVLKNIDALLKSQKLTAENVIKTTVFLKDMADFATVNTEYATFFNTNPPARSCVAVSGLPLGVLVEIEVIAMCV